MLTQTEIAEITHNGTCLEGEGVYYIPDSSPGHWRLTLRGIAFYKHALAHFGLSQPLAHVMSDAQLWALSGQLLRKRTLELGAELAQELESGKVPAKEHLLARTILYDSLPQTLRVAEHHCANAQAGRNVLTGPIGRASRMAKSSVESDEDLF